MITSVRSDVHTQIKYAATFKPVVTQDPIRSILPLKPASS